jgi:WD40 repeat protein
MKQMYTIENVHSGKIECCKFSSNGKQIISIGRDHLIKITDFATYKEIATIENHDLMIPST